MTDWQQETAEDYKRKGFSARSGFGANPALLVVDFINGFTDPASPLGGDFSGELAVTAQLLGEFRRAGRPVAYTIIAYDPDFRDAGLFIKKVPSLAVLVKGSDYVEIDDRIHAEPGDYIVSKKYASAFFGTNLDTWLRSHGVDTIVMTGCTTSGCIRASSIDSMQYGYHTVVVRDGVGDRAEGPHKANLFDIDAKYGDVVDSGAALDYVRALANGAPATSADDFQRWWQQGASASG